MLCEKCGKRTANVYLSQNIGGQKSELHVCTECAAQLGYVTASSPFGIDLLNLLSPSIGKTRIGECPCCGESYEEYKSTHLLGCDKCYSHFASLIENTLAKFHGHSTHTGKLPGKADAKLKTKRELENLKKRLKESVIQEKYEEAAMLRDKIREIEGGDI